MHSLRRSIIGKVGGIAALCAMLLLSLGPVASQMLRAERFEALLATVCASGAEAASGHAHRHADHDAIAHYDACGYCDLAAHAPAPPTFLRAPGSPPFTSDKFAAVDTLPAHHRPRFDDAQPRAPPAFA